MNKNILIAVLLLFAVCCLCSGAIGLATGGVLLFDNQGVDRQLPTLIPSASPTSQAAPTEETSVGKSTTPQETAEATPASPQDKLPVEIAAQMDEIQSQVEDLRGLTQVEPVIRTLLTADQLRERLVQDFLEENDEQELEDDLRVLSAFGLIDRDFNLYDFYIDLLSEQIAGYYDDENKEMVVIQGEEFDGPERLTYAHEFTHTLQDQHYGLRDGLGIDDDHCQADSEYCAAVQALLEGDATLTEQYWLYSYGSTEDIQQLDDFYQTMESPVYDSAPEFMKEDFAFSYLSGTDFVFALFEKGDFAAIDAAYAHPPRSTEQIMHPEKYPGDQPLEVFMPEFGAVLGRDLREIDRGVVGEWYTYLTLAKGRQESFRLADAQARKAADGWGGDAYAVYIDDSTGDIFLAVQWVWDTRNDASDFFSSLCDYGKFRWGGSADQLFDNTLFWDDTSDGAVIVQWEGLLTSWVIAPDSEAANLLLQSLGEGEHAGVN